MSARTGRLATAAVAGGRLATAAVVGLAGWSSYWHMVHVALRYQERPEIAYALPFSVDGMLVVASVAMAEDRRDGVRTRPWARVAFVIGVAASVCANVLAAAPNPVARVVAAWPAVALFITVEVIRTGSVRDRQDQPAVQVQAAPAGPDAGVNGQRVPALPPANAAPTDMPRPLGRTANDATTVGARQAGQVTQQVRGPDRSEAGPLDLAARAVADELAAAGRRVTRAAIDAVAANAGHVASAGPVPDRVQADPVTDQVREVQDQVQCRGGSGPGTLDLAARAVAGEVAAKGRRVTRAALAEGLRARGHRLSTDRAGQLARAIT